MLRVKFGLTNCEDLPLALTCEQLLAFDTFKGWWYVLTLPAAAIEAILKESGSQNCHLIEANCHTFQPILYGSNRGLYLSAISIYIQPEDVHCQWNVECVMMTLSNTLGKEYSWNSYMKFQRSSNSQIKLQDLWHP